MKPGTICYIVNMPTASPVCPNLNGRIVTITGRHGEDFTFTPRLYDNLGRFAEIGERRYFAPIHDPEWREPAFETEVMK